MATTLDHAYHQLPDHAAALYRLIGLHPVPEISAEVASAAFQDDPLSALEALLEAGLVSELPPAGGGQDRYRMLAAVHGHAAAQAAQHETERSRTAAMRRMCDSYVLSAAAARVRDSSPTGPPRSPRPTPSPTRRSPGLGRRSTG
ncbi:hypothetical protein E1265_34325 [Streptomyces sp. 8K308]|nr:hypothetical protein E1265_34325 [Streptomyces sp. 8K308]